VNVISWANNEHEYFRRDDDDEGEMLVEMFAISLRLHEVIRMTASTLGGFFSASRTVDPSHYPFSPCVLSLLHASCPPSHFIVAMHFKNPNVASLEAELKVSTTDDGITKADTESAR
jgi:hypothetical protein